jgi:RNA polymerase sigma-70 factor, ECF subfamily
MAVSKASGEEVVEAPREDSDVEAALRRGDKRRALTILMDRYGEGVRRFAYAMVRDRHLAEEVRQQVFVEAFRDLDSFAGRSAVRTWLFGIARHRSLDAGKKQRRWNSRFKNEAPPEAELDERELDQELDRNRLVQILTRCLDKLSPSARDAVVLRYHQELSYDEASEIAGDLAGTLQQRVARALPVLRRCLDAHLNPGETR